MKGTIGLAAAACILLFGAMVFTLSLPSPSAPPVSAEEGSVSGDLGIVSPAISAFLQQSTALEVSALESMDFSEINGVNLSDDKEQIIDELGLPLAAEQDELFQEETHWKYSGMNIAFTGNSVDFVSIPVESGDVMVGAERLPVTVEGWMQRFGEPVFKAEDGVGYVDPYGIAAKLFIDEQTGELQSVDFFWVGME